MEFSDSIDKMKIWNRDKNNCKGIEKGALLPLVALWKPSKLDWVSVIHALKYRGDRILKNLRPLEDQKEGMLEKLGPFCFKTNKRRPVE